LSGYKNIFITGKPGSGKTTLIKEVLKELNIRSSGFYTEEIRNDKGIRQGFKIVSLDGKEGILAHLDFKSEFVVGRYKVNLVDLENIGVKSILDGLENKLLIVIDEIGKMELFSNQFKNAVLAAIESKSKVLGTIKFTRDPFTEKIRQRKDTLIIDLDKEDKTVVKENIEGMIL